MNIFLENVKINHNSGPNYFGRKLKTYIKQFNCRCVNNIELADIRLVFIESKNFNSNIPIVQRLDGIYFHSGFDCNAMNKNIMRTYVAAKGVVFQTEFNKNLIFNWFGPHENYTIINNGSDLTYINSIQDFSRWDSLRQYEKVWSCMSHWHSFKRLDENIDYFLKNCGKDDVLVVAGKGYSETKKHPQIKYVGELSTEEMISLFKKTDYFVHLAYLDHCPNVVIDARACGCKIICSDSGGTKEIAGKDAILIKEDFIWDYKFIETGRPPFLNLEAKTKNSYGDSEISMLNISKRYYKFLRKNK
ncbi:MAG: hypothetical protein CL811_10855 [Colwelliaceae bacterium]|nr:hypothetical protein [Colwelliaceae bacterium]|tara:strand:- start:2079 stop:2987 length:909 start_codon:yes stop_codon:yes gene_type:complete